MCVHFPQNIAWRLRERGGQLKGKRIEEEGEERRGEHRREKRRGAIFVSKYQY